MEDVDISQIDFWSEANYMKRSSFCGNALLTLGGAGTTVTQTVTHNLGYIPFFEVYTDTKNDGTLWAPQPINQYTETSLSGPSIPDVTVQYWCTTTTLTINLFNDTTPVATGTRRVYWLIYLDYTHGT